jgi:hypothetical protein
MPSLGAIEPAHGIYSFNVEHADDGKWFAGCHFYYRSLAANKDLHILPRTPEPLDLLGDEDTPLNQYN